MLCKRILKLPAIFKNWGLKEESHYVFVIRLGGGGKGNEAKIPLKNVSVSLIISEITTLRPLWAKHPVYWVATSTGSDSETERFETSLNV